MNKFITSLTTLTILSFTAACSQTTPSQNSYNVSEVGKTQAYEIGTVISKRQVSLVSTDSIGSVIDGLTYGFEPTGQVSEFTIMLNSKKEIVVSQYANLEDKNIAVGDTIAVLQSESSYNRILLLKHPSPIAAKSVKKVVHKKSSDKKSVKKAALCNISKTPVTPAAAVTPVTVSK